MGQAEQLSNKKEICQAEHPPYGTDRAEQQPGGNSGQICKLVKGNQAEQCMSLGGYRVGHQSWTKGQDEHHHEERGQAEQRQVDVRSTGCLGLGGLTGDQDEHHHEGISNSSSSSRHSNNHQIRQPLTIQRAVARYVDCPVNFNHEQKITKHVIGPTEELDQAEQPRKNDARDPHTVGKELRQDGQAEHFHAEMSGSQTPS